MLVAVVRAVEDLGLFHHHMLGLEHQGAQRRHQSHGKHQRAQQGKAVGHGQRAEDAAFDALQREHGNQRRNHDGHGEQRGLGHGNGRIHNDVAHVVRRLRLSLACIADDVLGQHHGTVHHDAEVDGSHGDQIGGHAQPVQADEGHQQRQRNHGGHDQRATQAAQEQPQHGHDQRGPEQQVVLHGLERMAHQIGAVIVGDHVHAFRQAATVELIDLGMNVIEHDGRVGAALEQHNALHHIVLVVHAHRALTRRMRLRDTRHVTDGHGSLATHGNDHILNLLRIAQQADTANDEGLFAAAHQTTADVAVGLGQCIAHIVQRQTQAVKLLGVHFNVELLDEAANAHHVGHALHLLEHAHHMPFLLGAQLRQGVPVALQAIVENLAQRGVVGRHFRRHAVGQICLRQTLRNLGTRSEAFRVVVKDQVDHGETEIALRTQRYQTRRAVEFTLQRLRDLALHFLGSQARSLGDHADLHIGHVRVGFDGRLQIGVDAIDGNRQRGAQRQQSAMDDKCNK